MAERSGSLVRPTRMTILPARALISATAALVLAFLAAACGDDGSPATSRATTHACLGEDTHASAQPVLDLDLDDDGSADTLSYVPGTSTCGALLVATVDGTEHGVTIEDDLPVTADGSFAISVPGRVGDVAVIRQEHPRGGFQVTLLGWASGSLSSWNADGAPIFPFIATDALSTPLTATCTDGGFAITEARAHQPIGIAPAWDVHRTTYEVRGNRATKDAEEEVADNVLPDDLEVTYPELVEHVLFDDCRTSP
jgi:hypothetical protein